MHRKRIFLVPVTPTFRTDHIHGWKKIHLYDLDAGTLALLATASRDVERKAGSLETAHFGVRSGFEKAAYVVENARECGRIAARRTANRGLVDFYDLVYVFHPFNAVERQDRQVGHREKIAQIRHQGFIDKG